MFENKSYKKGEVIFLEGKWEMCMYYITSGKVGIYAGYENGSGRLLTTLESGKFFGEMGLVEAYPRSASAIAEEDVEVVSIDSDGLSEYFKNEPQKVVDILVNLSARLRELSGEYLEVCRTAKQYLDAEEGSEHRKGLFSKLQGFIAAAAKYTLEYEAFTAEHPELLINPMETYRL